MVPFHLDWLSGALAAIAIYFAGKKKWWSWLLSLLNLACLVTINLKLKLWGFMPLNALCAVIYIKNAIQWRRENK